MLSSSLDSHGTTDIKPEMSSGVQTGIGTSLDKYNIRGKQKRRHFYAMTSAKLYIYIDEAHRALDIFRKRFRDSAVPYTAVAVIFYNSLDILTIVSIGREGDLKYSRIKN